VNRNVTGSNRRRCLLAVCLLVFLSAITPSQAAEGEEHASSEAHASDSGAHSFHKNVVGAFVGMTHAGHRETEAAIGLEYSRRINEHFSIGGVAEYTGGDADLWVAVLPFGWHLGHWKLFVAPGVEDGHHGKEELIRLGVEYAFELGDGWEIAPQVNVDFVDSDDVWVFGFVFARGF
jgi:hypothetical protein